MNLEAITSICDLLGLDHTRPYIGHRENTNQLSISCPLAIRNHKDPNDSNKSCSVEINDNGPSRAHCFSGSCGFGGTFQKLIELAVTYRNQMEQFKPLLEEMSKTESIPLTAKLDKNKKLIEELSKPKIIEDNRDVIPETDYDEFRGKVPRYALDKRGITLETCKRWDLGYDESGKRLVFPVRRLDGKLIGKQGRDITGKAERPHHNYAGLNKSKYMLGEHLLEQHKPIVIVEGATGAVKTDQALYPKACTVASLGEGFSEIHGKTLLNMNPTSIYIFTDGDAPGRVQASKIEYLLHGKILIKTMECPTHDDEFGNKIDPGNMSTETIQNLFDMASPVLDRIRWKTSLTQQNILA